MVSRAEAPSVGDKINQAGSFQLQSSETLLLSLVLSYSLLTLHIFNLHVFEFSLFFVKY